MQVFSMDRIKKKALVADDDPDILEVISLILELNGFFVSSTLNGKVVHQMARNESPDILVLDVIMGDVDGRELCKELKADPALKSIPIFMFSANRGMRQSVLESGANYFMEKPFDLRFFTSKVKEILHY